MPIQGNSRLSASEVDSPEDTREDGFGIRWARHLGLDWKEIIFGYGLSDGDQR